MDWTFLQIPKEKVCKVDYFLSRHWAEFQENARLLIFETYCRQGAFCCGMENCGTLWDTMGNWVCIQNKSRHRINGNRAPDEETHGNPMGFPLGFPLGESQVLQDSPVHQHWHDRSQAEHGSRGELWRIEQLNCSVREFCHCPPVHLDACVGFTLALELVVEALPDTLGHYCRAGSRSLDCRTLRKSRGRYMY